MSYFSDSILPNHRRALRLVLIVMGLVNIAAATSVTVRQWSASSAHEPPTIPPDRTEVVTSTDHDAGPRESPPAPSERRARVEPATCGPPGAHCIRVAQLPARIAGNTAVDGVAQIDTYPCRAGSQQHGPETWFEVNVARPGILYARVTGEQADDGVDVDVHILRGTSATSCVSRGNQWTTAVVAAGVWWVVVDSWGRSVDESYPGPYTLELWLQPRPQRR